MDEGSMRRGAPARKRLHAARHDTMHPDHAVTAVWGVWCPVVAGAGVGFEGEAYGLHRHRINGLTSGQRCGRRALTTVKV